RDFLIETARLDLHRGSLFAHRVQIDRLLQPDRFSLYEAPHVLLTDQRDMLAKLFPVKLDQLAPVLRFFLPQPSKNRCRGQKPRPKSFRVIRINSLIFLFQRYSEGKRLTFAETMESPHHPIVPKRKRPAPVRDWPLLANRAGFSPAVLQGL